MAEPLFKGTFAGSATPEMWSLAEDGLSSDVTLFAIMLKTLSPVKRDECEKAINALMTRMWMASAAMRYVAEFATDKCLLVLPKEYQADPKKEE